MSEIADLVGQIGAVTFALEVTGSDGPWTVTHVRLNEAMNAVPNGIIDAVCQHHVEAADLLHSEFALSVERGDQARAFKGTIWQARVRETTDGFQVTLHVAPAAMLLGKTINSRIFQAKTIPQVIEAVYTDLLSGMSRTVRNDLQRTYETREYIVQYQETSLAFLSRLSEEAGIFWFFDHDGETEVLVLADTVTGLPRAREEHDGKAAYNDNVSQQFGGEHVWGVVHDEHIGPTDVVVADYDWTHPSATVQGARTGRSERQPALEVYDHTDALAFHSYDGSAYGANTAADQAQLRASRLDLDRLSWTMQSSVVTALPGTLLEVTGCPDGSLDQEYAIISATCRGSASRNSGGSWVTSLHAIPKSMTYAPSRRTARPVIPGVETAVVVGPSGEEIHTDSHGRIKVHFHWDRGHARDAEESSCWIRVAQAWAGPGWGTWFVPRIGMEVIVQFVGGNPDRPVVTGCLYNGENQTPYALPDDKTKSTIKTNSSPGGGGFNELRFEDKAGDEEIYLHAQKNLLERVLNNHTTRVGHDQTNTVDNDQTLTIHGKREKTVDKDEKILVKGTRDAIIGQDGGNDLLWVINNQEYQIDGNRTLEVAFGDTIEIRGIRSDTVRGSVTSTIGTGITQTIERGGWTMTTTGNVSHTITGGMVMTTSDGVTIDAAANVSINGGTGVEVSGQSITLRSNTEIVMNAPAGIRNVTPAAERNIITQTFHDCAQLVENIGGKMSAYTMAISLYGMKFDTVGLKIEAYGFKMDEAGFKASKGMVELKNKIASIGRGIFMRG